MFSKNKSNEANNIIEKYKDDLNLYKSIFTTHRHSAICNMYIKKKKGKRVWIDKVRDHFEFKEFISALALLTVSKYSFSGTLSATIPAPDCI